MTQQHGRTGRVSIDTQTSPVLKPREGELLCTFKSEQPKPVTLILSAQTKSFPNNPNYPLAFFLPCNLGGQEYPNMTIGRTGILSLEYGSGAARNFIFCDIRPGAYALPVCDFAQATIYLFHPHASAPAPMPGIDIAGTFVEGQHKNPARFTASLVATVQPTAYFSGVIPPHARWVDIEGGNVLPAGSPPVTEQGFRFIEVNTIVTGQTSGRYIIRDPANGVYVPDSLPVELGGGNGFYVWNDGAEVATITTKFFLEL